MRLAYLQYGNRPDDDRMAEKMLRSVVNVMPDLQVMHMTDVGYQSMRCREQCIPFADDDFFSTYAMKHYIALGDEPTIICDVDIIFRADIRYLFDQKFDVALCVRSDAYALPAYDRYIGGFILSRCNPFWLRCQEIVNCQPPHFKKWMGAQYALAEAAGDFKVLELPEAIYNYAPEHKGDIPADAKVLHYRGKRKKWLLDK